MNTINVENCKTLLVGRRGENEVTTVAFDFTEWASEFGSGVVDLYVKRFGDNSAYPVVLTIDGTIATWTVTATDTNVAGYGKAEYVYRVDGKIAKSAVFPFFVADDIGQPASEPPDPYESWLEQLTALGAETEAHAQAAEQSAEDAAESAEDAAQSAASAEGYAGQAETAAGLAHAAQTASEAARDAAQTAQASAESSATAASGSAASSASSATAAAGSASDASASASAASVSATAAGNAATQAEAAKTAAQTAQSAAEDAAADAQQAAQQAHVEYEQLSGEVDDLSDEVSQQKSAIEALDSLVDRKAGMLVDTASGSIASFVPDATIENLLGVSVDIEPVQDLHGYDSPWPAGGGANQWNEQWEVGGISSSGNPTTATDRIRSKNFCPISPSTSYYCLAPNSIWVYVYDENYTKVGEIGAKNAVITTPASAKYFKISCLVVSYANNIAINYPSTVTTYSPYSNECPISGWDAVEIERTGVNLFDGVLSNSSLTTDGTVWYLVNNASGRTAIIKVRPNTQYTISRNGGNRFILGESPNLPGMGANYPITIIANLPGNSNNYTFTTSGTAEYVVLTCTADSVNYPVNSVQLEYGSTATEYKPYAGNRYTIALGDTVYGAKLTIGNGYAKIVLTNGAFDEGQRLWNYYSSGGISFFYTNVAETTQTGSAGRGMMSNYPPSATASDKCYRWNGRQLRIYDSAYTSVAAFTASVAGQICVYPLETPIEITLDPVAISTISGQTNNVWANTGDVAVEFAADLKTYIDQKIAAAVAALS